MKTSRLIVGFLIVGLLLGTLAFSTGAAEESGSQGKIRVLLIHGGHEFETNEFFNMFRGFPEISLQTAEEPRAQEWFAADRAHEYDVLVFYDLWQTISEQAKTDLTQRVEEGKGLVALHHCLASFQSWPEYQTLIGGRYYLRPWTDGGVEHPASTYLHDVDFNVCVADGHHPITAGLEDFKIHDETYGGFAVSPQAHVLLTTDTPTSGRNLAWVKTNGLARVVYLQLGHDHQAYQNSNYQRLVRQAIEWAARR